VFGQINKVSDTVAQSSHSIQSESTQLSEAVQRQSAAIQETAASVNEINAMIRNNCDSAVDSRHHSKLCRDNVDHGMKAFHELLQSIEGVRKSQESIFAQVEQSNQGIAEINGIISQIDDKTRVINDIVFQTKLLSFNASVEAARAGEHGKGFAVVAEEVGNLAQMSGSAAREITGLLSSSTSRVSAIIASTRESVRQTIEKAADMLDSSIRSVREFEGFLSEIAQSVSQVDVKVDAITTASREQETAVEEISKVMQGLDGDTQKSALIAHSSAANAKRLNAEAAKLEELVQRMMILLQGRSAARMESREFRRSRESMEESAIFEEDDTFSRRAA
jgi:methyl-accepting chemotaxis protein